MAKRNPRVGQTANVRTEHHDPVADILGFGFRGWLTGLRNQDIRAWQAVWSRYVGVMGTVQARVALTELECWTRCIHRSSCRTIELECLNCPHLSRDERLAVSVVAAAQHGTCPAMRACAFSLMETSQIDPMIERAERVANVLIATDHVLAPWTVANAFEAGSEIDGATGFGALN